ncbi:MAG: hypothetical protein EZS28_000998 [Streblomastix strix]|uniref:Uncharacterized protein n=1 Tax=Streblomastix strix TaxID=222440 RepID=A0A5J4X9B0_9EUKA|nr:MAG: hypothetical protein EZS28_000998 [Streblomastix strix]
MESIPEFSKDASSMIDSPSQIQTRAQFDKEKYPSSKEQKTSLPLKPENTQLQIKLFVLFKYIILPLHFGSTNVESVSSSYKLLTVNAEPTAL